MRIEHERASESRFAGGSPTRQDVRPSWTAALFVGEQALVTYVGEVEVEVEVVDVDDGTAVVDVVPPRTLLDELADEGVVVVASFPGVVLDASGTGIVMSELEAVKASAVFSTLAAAVLASNNLSVPSLNLSWDSSCLACSNVSLALRISLIDVEEPDE